MPQKNRPKTVQKRLDLSARQSVTGAVTHSPFLPEHTMTTHIEQSMTDCLGGTFIRDRPDHLALLREYPDWPRMAQLLLDQRATQALNGLPDAELRAIAQGEVNINELARHWNA